MFALLFFLPVYFQVIKQYSPLQTALMLLPQTALILPCSFIVVALYHHSIPPSHLMLTGWFCTSCGVALLSMLDVNKSVSFDVLLNLLSGLGIGILLTALPISAKDGRVGIIALQAQTIFVSLRYLGSALGLVVTGIVFQHLLRRNLSSTKFESEAVEMTKHATTFVYSVRKMANSDDVDILIREIQIALRTTWITLAIMCLLVFVFSCVMASIASSRRQSLTEKPTTLSSLSKDLTV